MEANILHMDRYDKADSHFSQLCKWPKNVDMYVSIFEWVILVFGRGSTKNALSGKLALKEITDTSQDRIQRCDLLLNHHTTIHMSLNITFSAI
jgi:hypothetical protein